MGFSKQFVDKVRSLMLVPEDDLLAHALKKGNREVVEVLLRAKASLEPKKVRDLINDHEPKKVLKLCEEAAIAQQLLEEASGSFSATDEEPTTGEPTVAPNGDYGSDRPPNTEGQTPLVKPSKIPIVKGQRPLGS